MLGKNKIPKPEARSARDVKTEAAAELTFTAAPAADPLAAHKRPRRNAAFKIAFNVLFLLISVSVIALIASNEFGGSAADGSRAAFSEVYGVIKGRFGYLLVAVAMVAGLTLCDTLKILMLSCETKEKISPFAAYKTGALGRYYDGITPLGSGGQPFQVHYLIKKGVKPGAALSITFMNFFTQQLAYVIAAPVFLITLTVRGQTQAWTAAAMWIGYALFAAVPVLILCLTVREKAAMSIVNAALRLMKKMRLLKDYQKTSDKIRLSLGDYREAARAVFRSPVTLTVAFMLSFAHFALYFGVPYMVMRTCGVESSALGGLFSQMVAIFFTVSIVPSPGNSGASEATFYYVFKGVLAGGFMFWGVLLWRLLTFYFLILQGLIITLAAAITKSVSAVRKETDQT
ncbi:MAG: flippase-like domain-containing protein [Clostridiales bacterium]|jgi:uncharacterized protein (TIRG00374 family)|nr:flippase-like domain-containing protein [Clostridiales bacterium]